MRVCGSLPGAAARAAKPRLPLRCLLGACLPLSLASSSPRFSSSPGARFLTGRIPASPLRDCLPLTGNWPLPAPTARLEAQRPPGRSSQVNLLRATHYSLWTEEPQAPATAGGRSLKHNRSATTPWGQPPLTECLTRPQPEVNIFFLVWSFAS